MGKGTTSDGLSPEKNEAKMVLDEIVREGARQLLMKALNTEVQEYLDRATDQRDEAGHALAVRNGYGKERRVLAGAGELRIRAPRVNDKRIDDNGERCRFTSQILPPYLRRTKNMEDFLPYLYLKGISTGDFSDALSSLVGQDARGLSAGTISRLKQVWEQEHDQWRQRDLSDKHYAYTWVDGIYCGVRMEQEKQCILVILGATPKGKKELVAVMDGYRESEDSWLTVLRDLKSRGLKEAPSLATGDGALGFWKALRKEYPTAREQRCWKHKTCNVLDKMAKGVQGQAKAMLHDIYNAESKKSAVRAFNRFCDVYRAKYPKAVACLEKDRDELLTFFDFPAEHWKHIRTTNPIESTFSTVRLRTKRTRNCGSRTTVFTMVFKLVQLASRRWQRLNAIPLIFKVVEGYEFKDGVLIEKKAA
jgi:transposase-like protein